MILNIFNDISSWFFKVRENISLEKMLAPFLAGVGIGFILFLLLYILYVFVSFRKNETKTGANITIDNERINQIIINSKNRYNEESSMKKIAEKFSDLCEISWEMIQDIASEYYPNSRYPIYELSIEEFLLLNHYITDRVDSLFSGRVLKKMKEYKLSTVFKLIDVKKKYDETKVAKAAKKANISGFGKVVGVVLHSVNPFYWLKKAMIDLPFIKVSNKVALIIIDIVSEETVKVYSKSVFKKEDDVKFMQVVQEVEDMLVKNYEEEDNE